MKITEVRVVTTVERKETLVGRKCDICEKDIELLPDGNGYNYFVIHTWHNDWGNDSVESHEYFDACCPECALKFTDGYLRTAFLKPYNTKGIEIEHVRSLEKGASDRFI